MHIPPFQMNKFGVLSSLPQQCWFFLRLHFPTQIRRSASPFGRPERCQRCDNRNATNLVSPIGRPCSREGCRENRSEEHTSELQSLMRISSAVFCLTQTNTYIAT